MHSGDALWILYGAVELLERRATRQENVLLLGRARAALDKLSVDMGVPAPAGDKLTALLSALQAEIGIAPSTTGPEKTSRQQNVENARLMLDEMIASDLFSWASILTDFQAQLETDDPFFTNRQWRAMVNVAQRGKTDGGELWWDFFEDEHAELAAYASSRAAEAG